MKGCDYCDNFASRLRFLREENKISIKKLSEDLKIKEELIKDWEMGLKVVDLKRAILLARYFEVNLGFMVGTEDRQYVASKSVGRYTIH